MTAQRHKMLVAALNLTLLIVLWSAAAIPAIAATSERVIQNLHTGLALNGIDPVGYFTDGAPLDGLPEFEVSAMGSFWRFRNAGNLATFLAHPDVYAPQFGGYDPVDVARGVPGRGHPDIWLISGQRLYLFARETNRDAFMSNASAVVRDAAARWPTLLTTLAQ